MLKNLSKSVQKYLELIYKCITECLYTNENNYESLVNLENIIDEEKIFIKNNLIYISKTTKVYRFGDFIYKKYKPKFKNDYFEILEELKYLKKNNLLLPIEIYEKNDKVIEKFRYFKKGDLFDYITKKELNLVNKEIIFSKIVKLVQYLHNNGLAHRDLKPENILIDENIDLYLIDYDFCCKSYNNDYFFGGTIKYAAPEILNLETISDWRVVDIWSLGIILYILIIGYFPWSVSSKDCEYYNEYLSYKNNSEFFRKRFLNNNSKYIELISKILKIKNRSTINIIDFEMLQLTSI